MNLEPKALSDRDRSLINLMIAALNRPLEFKGHVRGALNNGVSLKNSGCLYTDRCVLWIPSRQFSTNDGSDW